MTPKTSISPAMLGFIRALGVTILLAGLTFLGNAANLNGIVSGGVATIIAAVAMMIEHDIESKTGNALFGAVQVRK